MSLPAIIRATIPRSYAALSPNGPQIVTCTPPHGWIEFDDSDPSATDSGAGGALVLFRDNLASNANGHVVGGWQYGRGPYSPKNRWSNVITAGDESQAQFNWDLQARQGDPTPATSASATGHLAISVGNPDEPLMVGYFQDPGEARATEPPGGALVMTAGASGPFTDQSQTSFAATTLADAADGAQSYSPLILARGRGWSVTGPGSRAIDMAYQVQPIQTVANPHGKLVYFTRVEGGGFNAYRSEEPSMLDADAAGAPYIWDTTIGRGGASVLTVYSFRNLTAHLVDILSDGSIHAQGGGLKTDMALLNTAGGNTSPHILATFGDPGAAGFLFWNMDPSTFAPVDAAKPSSYVAQGDASAFGFDGISFATQAVAGTLRDRLRIDHTSGANTTPLLYNKNGTLTRITIGASAGAGPLAGAADVGMFALQTA